MQQRIIGALGVVVGLGLSFAVLGATGAPEKPRYEVEVGIAQGIVPIVVRLDTTTGELCSFIFDQIQQSLTARGCYTNVDKGW